MHIGIIRNVNRAYLVVGGIGLVLMALHVSIDAIGKYLFSIPIPATLEIVAYYYMPAVVALPLAFVEVRNGHVAVEMVHQVLPPMLQRINLAINGLLTAAFLVAMTWLAGREAWRKLLIGEFMFGEYPIVIWPGRVIFALGAALFTIVVIVKTLGFIGLGRDIFASAAKDDGWEMSE